MTTATYSAAIDTSDIEVSFAKEVTWGVAVTTAFTKIRLTGESLSESKQRSRPQEINATGVVSHGITTQVGVEGAINFALSADTFDAFLEGAVNGEWSTDVLTNGTTGPKVTTFAIQKKLASAMWLQYTGCYITGFTLNASVGNFVEGSFSFIAKGETSATSAINALTIASAPAQRVIDTVAGVSAIEIDDVANTIPIQSIQLNVTKDGARQQFAIGSSTAQGIGRGTLNVTGSVVMYFKDFTMYSKYKTETDIKLEFTLKDSALDGYKFTLPVVSLMNPTIVAGGPDQDVMAEFQLEASPDGSNVIIQIDRIEQA